MIELKVIFLAYCPLYAVASANTCARTLSPHIRPQPISTQLETQCTSYIVQTVQPRYTVRCEHPAILYRQMGQPRYTVHADGTTPLYCADGTTRFPALPQPQAFRGAVETVEVGACESPAVQTLLVAGTWFAQLVHICIVLLDKHASRLPMYVSHTPLTSLSRPFPPSPPPLCLSRLWCPVCP